MLPSSAASDSYDESDLAAQEASAFGIPGLRLGPPGLSFFTVGHGVVGAGALPRELRAFARECAGAAAAGGGGARRGDGKGEEVEAGARFWGVG